MVVVALQESGHEDTQPNRADGCSFLARYVKPDGTIDEGEIGLDYPVYTAALSVVALSREAERSPAFRGPREAWLKYLLARQLTEPNGWTPDDKEYGGWGYCRVVPKKPDPGRVAPPLIESNLSATTFALDALAAAGHRDKKVYAAAVKFLVRRQNDDGGYHFIYDDPVRNKAGSPDGGRSFHSYGSATADAARAESTCRDALGLTACPPGKSLGWLTDHFRPGTHPGTYAERHEPNRDAVYFYYAASVARAFTLTGTREAAGGPWAPRLAEELVKRQRDDGSWANPVGLVREDDPPTATCWAVIALAHCRAAMR